MGGGGLSAPTALRTSPEDILGQKKMGDTNQDIPHKRNLSFFRHGHRRPRLFRLNIRHQYG